MTSGTSGGGPAQIPANQTTRAGELQARTPLPVRGRGGSALAARKITFGTERDFESLDGPAWARGGSLWFAGNAQGPATPDLLRRIV